MKGAAMNQLSLSGLEKQLMENIFALRTSAGGRPADRPGPAGDPSALNALTGLQATQAAMPGYTFRNLVDYFLWLEQASQAASTQPAPPLYAAPLHQNLSVQK